MVDRLDTEIRRSVECREKLLHEVPPAVALQDFSVHRLAYRVMWVSDTFEVGLEIDGVVDDDALARVLSNVARVSVMDLREVRACEGEG